MRDLKTYISVAPVLSTLCFGSLAGRDQLFLPRCINIPFFLKKF